MTNDKIEQAIKELRAFQDHFRRTTGAEPVCFGTAIDGLQELRELQAESLTLIDTTYNRAYEDGTLDARAEFEEEANKAKTDAKELERLQSIPVHTMSTSWGKYIFIYIENQGRSTVTVYDGEKKLRDYETKHLGKGSLETWSICWLSNQNQKEKEEEK